MKYDYFCRYKGPNTTDSVMSLLYSILKQKGTRLKLIFNNSLNEFAHRNLVNLFQASLKDSDYLSISVMANMGTGLSYSLLKYWKSGHPVVFSRNQFHGISQILKTGVV